MPIEIRELIVRATVDSGKIAEQKSANPAQNKDNSAEVDTDRIIQACVDQVLAILKRKQDR
jgi:hypothetical protein